MVSFPDLFVLLKTMPGLKKLVLVNTEFPPLATGMPAPLNACLTAPAPIVMQYLDTLNFTGWFLPRVTPLMQPLDMQAQQYIVDVFNSAPQVKHLELDILRGMIVQNFMVGISRLTKLETLNVHSLSEGDLQHLIRASPDLPFMRSMTFREVHLTNRGRVLLEVLKLYAERLEHLNIRVLTTRDVRIVQFPYMGALKTLHLDTFYTLDQFLLDTSLLPEPQNPFPNLNKLIVSQNVLEGMILANLKSSSVKELVVKMTPTLINGFRNAIQDEHDPVDHPLYDRRQADAVREITTAFPLLKKLKVIDTRCSVIRVIFQTLTELEELEIQHSIQRYGINATVDLNRVLTGLDHPLLHSKMLQLYGSDPEVTEEKKKIVLEYIHACSPISVRNMKKLKVLILSGRQCIDESAVQLSLLHMPSLDKLVFSEKSVCFGRDLLVELRKRHKMVQVVKSKQPVPSHMFLDMVY